MSLDAAQTHDHAAAVSAACAAAGGASSLAEKIGVQPSAVSNWKQSGIPAARVGLVSRVTGLPLHELRGDLFPRDAG